MKSTRRAVPAPRKARLRASRHRQQQDTLELAFSACQHLGTLGELLAALQTGRLASVTPETVSHAGAMIAQEARHLAGLIEAVHAGFSGRPRPR